MAEQMPSDEYDITVSHRPIGIVLSLDTNIVEEILENDQSSHHNIVKGDKLVKINGTSMQTIESFQQTELPFTATFRKAMSNNQRRESKRQHTINHLQHLSEWNAIDVLQWLISYGKNEFGKKTKFAPYQFIFWKHKIDGAILKTLRQIDLYNLGVESKEDCYDLFIGIQSILYLNTKNIKPLSDNDINYDEHRRKLLKFYRTHNPKQILDIERIDEVLRRYKGREDKLFADLNKKYIEDIEKYFEKYDDSEERIIKRICFILPKYVEWINECIQTQKLYSYQQKIYGTEDKDEIFDVNAAQIGICKIMNDIGYDNILLLDDFNFIKGNYCDKNKRKFHWMYKYLCNAMKQREECDLFILSRHYRDRSLFQNEQTTKEWYFGDTKDYNSETIITQQIMDKIYCFFMNSYDFGLILTEKEHKTIKQQQKQSEATLDEASWHKSSALMYLADKLSEKRKKMCVKLEGLNERRYKIAKNRFCTSAHGKVYKFYYWDYYKNNEYFDPINDGYRYCDWYVPHKYQSLKIELMMNKKVQITVSLNQWNQIKYKAEQYQKTKFVKAHFSDITIAHLIALLVYCNFDAIQREFRGTFYKNAKNESNESLILRHSKFCHFGRLLRECIEKYGKRKYFYTKYAQSFYHGIGTNVPFESVLYTHSFVSFSTSYQCVLSFCVSDGLILRVEEENNLFHCTPKYVNCSVFSDYPAENEHLFVPAEIANVSLLRVCGVLHPEKGFDFKLLFEAFSMIKEMIKGWYLKKYSDKKQAILQTLVQKMIAHKLDLNAMQIPKYIATLLDTMFDSVLKVSIIWESWNEAVNEKNEREIGYKFIQNVLINANFTFVNFELMLILFPNMTQMKIVNDFEYKESKLMLSTDILNEIFDGIKEKQHNGVLKLEKVVIVSPKQSQLTIFRAIEIYDKIYAKIGWNIKRGEEDNHILIEKNIGIKR